jgi:hypothetical protein
MANIWSIRGVPLNTHTIIFERKLSGLNFDIVQKQIISPKGNESISVNANRNNAVTNPLPNLEQTSIKSSIKEFIGLFVF